MPIEREPLKIHGQKARHDSGEQSSAHPITRLCLACVTALLACRKWCVVNFPKCESADRPLTELVRRAAPIGAPLTALSGSHFKPPALPVVYDYQGNNRGVTLYDSKTTIH